MTQSKSPENLSTRELRQLLIEKQRSSRSRRLDYYRRTGRVITASLDRPAKSYQPVDSDQDYPLGPRPRVATPKSNPSAGGPKPRSAFEKLLLAVEIGALAGLVGIVIFIFIRLNTINNEAALAFQQPTLAATPILNALVLPSGHTSPDSPGGVQPNDSEIPEHLRPLVQSVAKIPVPTAGPQQAVRLQIPAIEVDAPVIQGDGWEQLKKGIGQHSGSANPGEKGNVVLSAHNDVFGEIFRNLDRLQEGDKIILFSSQRTYTYIVRQKQVVEPTQVEVMNQTEDATLTLISCYPYLVNNKRIVVTAYLEQ